MTARISTLGVYGGPARRPNLDRLAGQGIAVLAGFSGCAHVLAHAAQHYTGIYRVKSGNQIAGRPGGAKEHSPSISSIGATLYAGYVFSVGDLPGDDRWTSSQNYHLDKTGVSSRSFAALTTVDRKKASGFAFSKVGGCASKT